MTIKNLKELTITTLFLALSFKTFASDLHFPHLPIKGKVDLRKYPYEGKVPKVLESGIVSDEELTEVWNQNAEDGSLLRETALPPGYESLLPLIEAVRFKVGSLEERTAAFGKLLGPMVSNDRENFTALREAFKELSKFLIQGLEVEAEEHSTEKAFKLEQEITLAALNINTYLRNRRFENVGIFNNDREFLAASDAEDKARQVQQPTPAPTPKLVRIATKDMATPPPTPAPATPAKKVARIAVVEATPKPAREPPDSNRVTLTALSAGTPAPSTPHPKKVKAAGDPPILRAEFVEAPSTPAPHSKKAKAAGSDLPPRAEFVEAASTSNNQVVLQPFSMETPAPRYKKTKSAD